MENKWYVGNNSNDSQGLIIEENTGRNVAVSYDPKDAALIAAAPELLAALEDARIALSFYREWMKEHPSETVYPFGNATERLARDVIARANGE